MGQNAFPSPEPFEFQGAGVRLRAERWEGAGLPERGSVVLLHGGGQTRHSWGKTARHLAAGNWTTIAYDARGHGDSDWHPEHDYSLDGFVEDLLALVATLDRPPVLVGASLGGITSLVAAAGTHSVASGLVLVDVVVEMEARGIGRIQQFMTAHRDGFASLDEVADAVAAYNPTRRRPRNLDGLRKNVRLGEDGRWRWHWDPAFVRLGDEPRRGAGRASLRAAAARLTIPTMVVRGGESDVVSDAGLADMLQLVPHATSVDVSAAGHMVAGDDNDVFAVTLDQFLEGLDGDRS
jgi:non-heme chloroperoxidase